MAKHADAAMKQKLFRIEATLAAAFEAWCNLRGMKQEHAAEAALFFLLQMPPEEREDLLLSLSKWKATQAGEASAPAEAIEAAADAVKRQRAARARSKARRGQKSA